MNRLSSITFTVAHMTFTVTDEEQMLLQKPDRGYVPFLRPFSQRPDVELRLRIGIPTDIAPPWEVLADSPPWFLARRNGVQYLSTDAPPFTRATWVAQLNADWTQANVYFGEHVQAYSSQMRTYFNLTFPLEKILLMHRLPRQRGAIVHTAAILRNGKTYLFPGKSGAGKSTLSRILQSGQFGDIMSDDRVVVRKIDERFEVFGTPWSGTGSASSNAHAPLDGVFFVTHGRENRLTPLTIQDALKRLLPVLSIPWYDAAIVPMTLAWSEELLTRMPAYELAFKPDADVIEVLTQFLDMKR